LIYSKPKFGGFDVEGPLVNPASDFAWLTYDQLLSESTKEEFPRKRCVDYDENLDDGRYFYELNNSVRHSTGMWPALSLALAAYDGKNDSDLTAFAEKTTQLNPGTDKLMNDLLKKFDGEVFLITSSYSAVALNVAKKYDIPFSHVATNGFQRSLTDRRRDIAEEIENRSPMLVLSGNKKGLGKFLHEYLDVCDALGQLYSAAMTEEYKKEIGKYNTKEDSLHLAIRNFKDSHDELFEKIHDSNLSFGLKDLFLMEEGVMGSHRKVDAMRKFRDNRRLWSYAGDGIVDGMPIDYAYYGISINMKDKHALRLSKMNFATTDMSHMIPVFDAMFNGNFNRQMKERLDSEKLRVFTPIDIQQDIDAVIKVNGEAKNKLKELYVPVKV
jgi:predicted HAD superfamily phosphohydrolase